MLFVEMEIPAKTARQLASFPQERNFGFLLELLLHRGWKNLRKQKTTNLRLSDVIWLFNAAMLTASPLFQYLSSFGHGHFLLIL